MTSEHEDFTRPQRHDIATERAVLGAMMLSPESLAECLELVTAAAFLRPAHQIVFAAIAGLADTGEAVDWLTVRAELERRGEIRQAGGEWITQELINAVPVAANGAWYARKLLGMQSQRDLDTAGTRIRQVAGEAEASPQERIEKAYEALDEACGYTLKSGAVPVSDLILPLIDSLERGHDDLPGIPTGWTDVNAVTQGLRPGQMIVIAGRPGMGKSVALQNIAAHAALRAHQTVLAVTLEMSRDEYMERLLSAEAGVALTCIRDRALTAGDWDRIAKVQPDIGACRGLAVHEGPQLTVQDIRSELRSMRRAGQPADLVTVDYLQLIQGPAKHRENRQAEISEISRGLKLLAKESGVPVVVGAQLNRGPEQRTDHHPVLADIRESGALENDADVVILLYRDDAYFDESPRAGEIDFIIAKNRSGPRTTVSLAFQGHYSRCMDMASPDWSASSVLGGAA